MQCVECGRTQEPSEWGWVVVLTRPNEARMDYCPDCFAKVLGTSSGDDKPINSSD